MASKPVTPGNGVNVSPSIEGTASVMHEAK
jgi:hypothetical protein